MKAKEEREKKNISRSARFHTRFHARVSRFAADVASRGA